MVDRDFHSHEGDTLPQVLERLATEDNLWGDARLPDLRRIRAVYIAGPMRGYDRYNFPAFDRAADELRRRGLIVVSPAELDREEGFNENTDGFGYAALLAAVIRDAKGLTGVDAVILLDGWQKSRGATAEAAIAAWIGIPVFGLSYINDTLPLFYSVKPAVGATEDGSGEREARAGFWQSHIKRHQLTENLENKDKVEGVLSEKELQEFREVLNSLVLDDAVVEGPEIDECEECGEDCCDCLCDCSDLDDEDDDDCCDDDCCEESGGDCDGQGGCQANGVSSQAQDFWDGLFKGVTDALNNLSKKSGPASTGAKIDETAPEDILQEALRITTGDRNVQYGDPLQDFTRTAQLWTALFGRHFSAHEVALAQIALKLSRICWSPGKRDHWVDVAGYARCGHRCTDALVCGNARKSD
jgi:hypothetical protein